MNSPKRGPYRVRPKQVMTSGEQRPSQALAVNIRCYRMLRDMTQDQLASTMTSLGHRWRRSVVSAIEANGRNVTIDEVFGLAICFGVAVGKLFDPSGPDRSWKRGLDVGVGLGGQPGALPAVLSSHLAMSRAHLRLAPGDSGALELDSEDASAEAP